MKAAGLTILCSLALFSADVSELNRSIAQATDPAKVLRLLTERKALIAQMIRTSPELVSGVALDPATAAAAQALNPSAGDLIETRGTWTGRLEVLAEMDFEKHTGLTHRYLSSAEGRIELFGAPRTFNHMDSLGGREMTVHGTRSDNLIAVDSIQPGQAAAALVPVGAQNYAVLLVTSPANPAFPAGWTTAAIQNLFFGTSGATLNTFWQEASYGKASAQGAVFGPFSLSSYTCSDPQISDSRALLANAIAAANGTVDFTKYNRVAIVFAASSCDYGGLASIGVWSSSGLAQPTSVAWLPVSPGSDIASYLGILAHEAGHNLGLNHANSEDFGSSVIAQAGADGIDTEYGDPYSVMGLGEHPGTVAQYSAQHKAEILGWLDSSGYQQVSAAGSYNVNPLEGTSGLRGIRVLRDPVQNSWLWIEARQPIGQFDTTLTSDAGSNVFKGALIHFENPDLDSLHTYLLDFQPVQSPNNFNTSAMTAGQTWSDPFSLLNLTLNSSSAAGLSVNVGYDSPCAAMKTSGTVIPLSGGSTAVQVTAPSSCSWTVTPSDSWLSASPSAGSGNATVNVSAVANGTSTQRSGVVTIQRQSVAFVQQGPGITGVAVTPISGSGTSGSFTFQFADTAGYADLEFINGEFAVSASGASICDFELYVPGGYIWLRNDSNTAWLSPVYLNKPGTSSSNSTCTLLADGSSISASGQLLSVTVHLQFAASVTGSFGVFGSASTGTVGTGVYNFGSWTIPAAGSSSASPMVSSALSAASFVSGSLAPESIAALFGSGLSTATASACCLPLPTNLGAATVSVIDSAGVSRAAPLYYASPAQINFEVPAGTATGNAKISVQSGNGAAATIAAVSIGNSAPGIFLANSQGLPAALTLTNTAGIQSVANVFQVVSGSIVPLPVDLSQGSVFLLLFGTGIRNAKSVTATVGGIQVAVPFAGAQGTFVGEDQINIGPLPVALAGKGSVPVILTADGQAANAASITIK